jgi:4a-hydroxytetrahydrobiopterin dehydratase
MQSCSHAVLQLPGADLVLQEITNLFNSNDMKPLNKEEVSSYLASNLKSWIQTETSITREFKFRNFVDAFSFMTAIALEAEKIDHHPDWKNVYNQVSVSLNTHSVKGITQLDFDLAKKIDALYKQT